ncbi:MAG: hypothetical protein IKO60_02460 [Bacteroidaceae bacterium]|nr:hypothetical protein [Bacteroidaceae bacterium]
MFFRTSDAFPRTPIKNSQRKREVYAPRSIGLHSTEHRLTLHGAWGYAPRSIGLHSTEHQTMPYEPHSGRA